MQRTFDAITVEIIQNSLQAVADEMFAAMRRTAMSAIIYEVLDMGTGVTDRYGEMAGSGAGIPAFVSVLDKSVKRLIERFDQPGDIEPGDVFLINDPYHGGVTHLNDMILAMPVFVDEDENAQLVAWTANIAHWNDVGGMVPGSMSPDATEIFQEGILLPGVKLISRGEPIRSVFDILTANCRMPDFLTGDLWAGIAAVRVGARRIVEIADKYGVDTFLHAIDAYLDLGERVSLQALQNLPNGTWSTTELQDNGQTYAVTVTLSDDEFTIDLRDNPDQDPGPYNASRDRTLCACQMAFKAITSPADRRANGGTFRPMRVLTREGSVFDPSFPAAMGIYYEISIRITDLVLRCVAQAMPERLPAGSFSSVCGTLFGGIHPDTGRAYAVIEPEMGGWGGSACKDGNAGQFSSNHGETYNCPAEVAEARYGVTVEYLGFHDEEGGAGKYRGGKGVRLDYRICADDAWLTAAYTRSKVLPWPLMGGQPGSANHIVVRRANGERERYSVVSKLPLNEGDVIQVMTATGAGWGDPKERDRALVMDDVKNEYITVQQARDMYGCA